MPPGTFLFGDICYRDDDYVYAKCGEFGFVLFRII
jgi:hypothetical protein